MFCPRCGYRQVANDARFCPSCGLALDVVGELLANNGQLPWRPPAPPAGQSTPRSRGIKQGAFMMLSTLVVVPVVIFLGVVLLRMPAELIPLAAIICTMGGLMRLLYAVFFESNAPADVRQGAHPYAPPAVPPNYLGAPYQPSTLPPPQPPQGTPVTAYRAPQRYNTGELVPPPRASVTDHTTRLLEKQPDEPPRD